MKTNVYLAGGTVGGWQHEVMDNFGSESPVHDKVQFYNPADFMVGSIEYPDEALYSPMNRLKIDECDIMFANLQAGNPTPINTALEIGYALGQGKTVIFCNGWTDNAFENGDLRCLKTEQDGIRASWFKTRYLAQLKNWVTFYEEDFGIAILLLQKILEYEHDQVVREW